MIIVCLIGLSLRLYPAFADYWNSTFASHVITDYEANMTNLVAEDYDALWEAAIDYNRRLAEGSMSLEERDELYKQCLTVNDSTSMMGYIDIDRIGVTLPIYHGTSDEVLQIAVGHLEWTSLPTGGPGTHCVLSGHRGLASAKLFTDLDALREGDTFVLTILDQVFTYEVDQIRTVEPENTTDLHIVPGKDYCTLVTCTPYGINTHRLLVRGHRIESAAIGAKVISEAVLIDPVVAASVMMIPLLLILFLMVMLKKPAKKRTKEQIIREIQEKNHS